MKKVLKTFKLFKNYIDNVFENHSRVTLKNYFERVFFYF